MELGWAMNCRDRLAFDKPIGVGSLVFKFKDEIHDWRPYWVVDEKNGKYDVTAAYGDELIKGVEADKLGVAVNGAGKTRREI